jgi:hypothetical protein
MNLSSLKRNELPEPPYNIWKLLGPSFIFVGLALGSGELILWPNLVSNWGMGIIWGALLGITMQYFLNMEIERYALANGESIFVGFARLFKFAPYWFAISTIIAWSWPGFAAASAQILTYFGVENKLLVSVAILILVGIVLTLGPTLYKTVETIEKGLILIAIPSIIIIAIASVTFESVDAMLKGLIGIGEGYRFFPDNTAFPFFSFLGAVAYSGAGGNLLLAQSFYIKEKGYGMGKYSGKITSLVTGKQEKIDLEGSTFEPSSENINKFHQWFNMASKEHLIVFWGLGLFTMLLLALIAHANVFEQTQGTTGVGFLFVQADILNSTVGFLAGSFLLVITALMLFSTQLTVVDACGRIIAENIAIMKKSSIKGSDVPKYYYASIWTILLFGVGVLSFGLREPQFLLILGAVINAFCMLIFAGILVKTNTKLLHPQIAPTKFRQAIIYTIFILLIIFCGFVIYDQITKLV